MRVNNGMRENIFSTSVCRLLARYTDNFPIINKSSLNILSLTYHNLHFIELMLIHQEYYLYLIVSIVLIDDVTER